MGSLPPSLFVSPLPSSAHRAGLNASASWFSVDTQGLAQTLTRRSKDFIVYELLQNALDENVTRVEVEISTPPDSGPTIIRVTDNAPGGIQNMEHIFTLYAPSARRLNPGSAAVSTSAKNPRSLRIPMISAIDSDRNQPPVPIEASRGIR